jgi:class 3 adenylate cyclase
MTTTRSPPGGLRSPPAGARSRAPGDPVEPTVVGDTVHLAYCLQDAARSTGASVVSEARGRRGDLADWTVEERLALVAKGRAAPLAVCRVRPVATDAAVWMS